MIIDNGGRVSDPSSSEKSVFRTYNVSAKAKTNLSESNGSQRSSGYVLGKCYSKEVAQSVGAKIIKSTPE
jgi:hypothetical protein